MTVATWTLGRVAPLGAGLVPPARRPTWRRLLIDPGVSISRTAVVLGLNSVGNRFMTAPLRLPATGPVVVRGILADAKEDHTALRIVSVPLSGPQRAMHLSEVPVVSIVPKVTRIAVLEPRLRVLEVATATTSLCRGPLAGR